MLISKQKWGDKAEALNETWKRKIAEVEKEYSVKLEQSNTNIERINKKWEVKYVEDIAELKKIFKDSEKIIKLKSVSSSRRSLVGKFIEKFVPFLSKIPFMPADMHFLGQPVDYIVFEGLNQDNVQRVIFLEVKTGSSKLTKREKSLKETIVKKKVYWKEINIDTSGEETPDKSIENQDTSIDEVYDYIDNKLNSVKSNLSEEKSPEETNPSEDYKRSNFLDRE